MTLCSLFGGVIWWICSREVAIFHSPSKLNVSAIGGGVGILFGSVVALWNVQVQMGALESTGVDYSSSAGWCITAVETLHPAKLGVPLLLGKSFVS